MHITYYYPINVFNFAFSALDFPIFYFLGLRILFGFLIVISIFVSVNEMVCGSPWENAAIAILRNETVWASPAQYQLFGI